MYNGKKYGVSKSVHNHGKSFKIFAEELGGKDFVSLNFYQTKNDNLLKPCEMPAEKVIQFLQNVRFE